MTIQTLRGDPLGRPGVRHAAARPEDQAAVTALVDAAFGPGRFAKTAERLREGNAPRDDLSLCAWAGGELIGVVRLWPVLIGRAPAVFLGPIAVDSDWRSLGLGAELVTRACHAAQVAGDAIVILVGDLPFFGPLGFERAPETVRLPGPVAAGRVLWRGLVAGALDGVEGRVTAAPDGAPLPISGERA